MAVAELFGVSLLSQKRALKVISASKPYCSSTDKNKCVFSKHLALYTKVLGVLWQAALSPARKYLLITCTNRLLHFPCLAFISLMLLTEK